MKIQEWVFGRVGQSFSLLKDNFISLTWPIFIYNFIVVVVIWAIFMSILFSNLVNLWEWTTDWLNVFENPFIITSITIWIVIFIVYLILYIPITLWLLKTIKQIIDWEKVTTTENLLYGLSNILNSFKTYWYIFSYVALIPAIIFIIWWLLMIAWFVIWVSVLTSIWTILMWVWTIVFVFFAIYKWVKSTFWLYSAVNFNDYSKTNFLNSVSITNNKWWNIIWNFIIAGIIIWLISFTFGLILWTLTLWGIDFESIKTLDDLSVIAKNFSIIPQITSGFFNNILNTITTVYVAIFTYLLFLKLKWDVEWNDFHSTETKESDTNIEL